MRNLFNGFALACLLSLDTGCIGLIGGQQLTTEQLAAMRDYNGDVYACISVNGPPPGGGGIFLIVPKGIIPNIQFSPSCQILSGNIGNFSAQDNPIRSK